MVDLPTDRWDKEEDQNDENWKNRNGNNDLVGKINKIIDYVELVSSRVNNLQIRNEFLMGKISQLGASITILENELINLKQNLKY